jgi:hypothetical protein
MGKRKKWTSSYVPLVIQQQTKPAITNSPIFSPVNMQLHIRRCIKASKTEQHTLQICALSKEIAHAEKSDRALAIAKLRAAQKAELRALYREAKV